jgi:DNA modification methylase
MNSTYIKIGEDIILYHADCMDIIPKISTLFDFDAIVTDPPYGLGEKVVDGKQMGRLLAKRDNQMNKMCEWDKTAPQGIIDSLLKLLKPTIIWGGNYFQLPPSRQWLMWDKGNSMRNRSFAEGEMAWAWCSFDGNLRIKTYNPLLESLNNKKYHPTQKPLEIMNWCLSKLPKDCKVVFDPFMGSGTTGVAAIKAGMKFIGIEKDKDYFDVAVKRIKEAYDQQDIFYIQQTGIKGLKYA